MCAGLKREPVPYVCPQEHARLLGRIRQVPAEQAWGGWEFPYLGRLVRDRLAERAAAAALADRAVRCPFPG